MDIGSIGTHLHTLLYGEQVGSDEFGNKYYRNPKKLNGRERRWVIYKGKKEASKIPPEWHAWIHHTTDAPLSEAAAQPEEWYDSHIPNLTGTLNAYRPQGSDEKGGRRATTNGDYQAWTPDS
ncbi:MAG: NADH:ubiquinone oxidoreductase subunit NDUFA12 [Magnetovibrio sp.]|nr:NADH:ubiquinone oxidoreductase subunit NDUFA12 [Magnetovibrio sp.]